MVKLQTAVEPGESRFGVSLSDSVLVLGSCFADGVGRRLADGGFDALVNPFGALYNPVSVLDSLRRTGSGRHFTADEVVRMESGSNLWCSHSHHSSFARETPEEFLSCANAALDAAHTFWERCDRLIITLGTCWVWEKEGRVVSNCLKRDSSEFVHRPLSLAEVTESLEEIIRIAGEGRKLLFTVSPVRHLWNGAHSNQLSKAALLLSLDEVIGRHPDSAEYFPAYEIVLDELRDYRFFGDDMTHPTALAVGCVWEKFLDFAVPAREHERVRLALKSAKAAGHRPLR